MRPCGPRARQASGMLRSSNARCCSRSTAAAAGPPHSRRTGCGTCVCATDALQNQRPTSAGHQRASGRLGMQAAARAGRTLYTRSPRAAARASAGAGPPGWPPTGPLPRCAGRPRPQSARRPPQWCLGHLCWMVVTALHRLLPTARYWPVQLAKTELLGPSACMHGAGSVRQGHVKACTGIVWPLWAHI